MKKFVNLFNTNRYKNIYNHLNTAYITGIFVAEIIVGISVISIIIHFLFILAGKNFFSHMNLLWYFSTCLWFLILMRNYKEFNWIQKWYMNYKQIADFISEYNLSIDFKKLKNFDMNKHYHQLYFLTKKENILELIILFDVWDKSDTRSYVIKINDLKQQYPQIKYPPYKGGQLSEYYETLLDITFDIEKNITI